MQFVRKNFLLKSLASFVILSASFSVAAFGQRTDTSLRNSTIKNISNDDVSGEDLEIRKAAIEALGERAGTVVVMSAQSGRIYTIVNQAWAVKRGFKPCSTIKLVTGVAGYNESLISSNGNLAKGSYRLGLDQSLAYSNNSFFQKVGANLGNKKMIRYSRLLGLGEPTGINIPGETAGSLPHGNHNLRIYSHADGFLVTPLQLAVMVSAITNGGDLLVPQVAKTRYTRANFRGYYKRRMDLDATVFERVIPGMIGAVKYGTAARAGNRDLKIAGKTGSCISRGTWVGLFASVAPIIKPKFAVVVITEGKYARGKYSSAIAGKIYNALRDRFKENFDGKLARKTVVVRSAEKGVAKNTTTHRKTPIRKTTIITAGSKNPSVAESGKRTRGTNGLTRDTKVIKVGAKKKKKPVKAKKKELFPTIVIGGKTEIARPRVVVTKN